MIRSEAWFNHSAHLLGLWEYQFDFSALLTEKKKKRAGEGVQSRLIDHKPTRAGRLKGWEERAAHLVDTNRQLSGKLKGFIIRLSDIHFFFFFFFYPPTKPFPFLLITFKRFLLFFFQFRKK